jgi:hypothetical protein
MQTRTPLQWGGDDDDGGGDRGMNYKGKQQVEEEREEAWKMSKKRKS